MREPYVPIFCSITQSTLWSADAGVCKVYITMLAMADPEGFVASSLDGIAALARMSIDDTESALATLMAPDKRSRSQEHEGRRVFAVPRGWHIPALPVFRALARKEAEKARKRAWARDNNSGRPTGASATARPTETETETETIKDPPVGPPTVDKPKRAKRRCQLPDDFAPNAEHAAKAASLKLDMAREFEAFRNYHEAKGTVMAKWGAAFRNWLDKAPEFKRGGPAPSKSDEPIRYVR